MHLAAALVLGLLVSGCSAAVRPVVKHAAAEQFTAAAECIPGQDAFCILVQAEAPPMLVADAT